MDHNQQILDEIMEIKKKQDEIERIINIICEKLDKISNETNRMDSHVTFVEDIYDKIKSPFHFIMDKVNNTRLYLT